ncbi:hypothetical protein MASR2M78_13820 [Treponema sp.]
MMPKTVALVVAGVAYDEEAGAPFVLLRNESGNLLSVPVGAFEASAIIIQVEGINPPRPLTHDILAQFFLRHGFRLLKFELYAKDTDGYLGKLHYRKGLANRSMEVRPSDGIALALRLGAAIEMNADLAEDAVPSDAMHYAALLQSQSVLYLDNKEKTLQL